MAYIAVLTGNIIPFLYRSVKTKVNRVFKKISVTGQHAMKETPINYADSFGTARRTVCQTLKQYAHFVCTSLSM